ncbi:SRPBCC family protein [Nocardia sp. NPDC088792]|uniref:SRPBCC family protein n=1 Tax=Nocardia sp. NPDC088792 TaxID=3364332 RepID=UPI00382CF9B2
MTKLLQSQSEVILDASQETVFDVVTGPILLPRTSSSDWARMEFGPPTAARATFVETIELAGEPMRFACRVDTCRRPFLWMASTRSILPAQFGGVHMTLTAIHTVDPWESGRTRFRRSMIAAVRFETAVPQQVIDLFGNDAVHEGFIAQVQSRIGLSGNPARSR